MEIVGQRNEPNSEIRFRTAHHSYHPKVLAQKRVRVLAPGN